MTIDHSKMHKYFYKHGNVMIPKPQTSNIQITLKNVQKLYTSKYLCKQTHTT